MSGRLIAALLCCFCSASGSRALAEGTGFVHYSDIARGIADAERVVLEIANHGRVELACTASLAHWYSADLGTAAPGTALEVILWHDPGTGVLNLLNPWQDRMPVEAIWCSRSREQRRTRARVSLPFEAGPAPARLSRICREAADGAFDCTEAG